MKTKTITLGLLVTLTALSLTACGGGGDSDSSQFEAHPFEAPAISEAEKNAFLTAVNNARAHGRSCGSQGYFEATTPLQWDDRLYKSAYEHSLDMASTGVMQHMGSNTATDWTSNVLSLGRGSFSGERISNSIGSYPHMSAENIAYGTTSLGAVIDAWLRSDGHCSTMMSGEYERFGMARVGNFWTQNFMTE